MGVTVPLQAIVKWEDQHAVQLPVEYREFLLKVGNGPCGPGYGLASFPQSNPCAGKTCRITTVVVSSDPNTATYYDRFIQHDHGFIRLCDYGCAMQAILILTGQFAGHVWLDGAGSGDLSPFPPMLHDLSRADDDDTTVFNFFSWYDDWLNCAIDGRAIP